MAVSTCKHFFLQINCKINKNKFSIHKKISHSYVLCVSVCFSVYTVHTVRIRNVKMKKKKQHEDCIETQETLEMKQRNEKTHRINFNYYDIREVLWMCARVASRKID